MYKKFTLKYLAEKLNFKPGIDFPPSLYLDSKYPIPDLPFVLDESVSGLQGLLDGRKRFCILFTKASHGEISWDISLNVQVMNIKKELESPVNNEIPGVLNSLIDANYIRDFLVLKKLPNSEFQLTPEILESLTREIYRHITNAMRSINDDPFSTVKLVAKLSSFLHQYDIATLLIRSKGWVSEMVAVSQLPWKYLDALHNGEICLSAAITIAKGETEEERDLLFKLSKKMDVRGLKAAFRYLDTKPGLAGKSYAYEKLLKLFSKKVLDVGGRARLQIQLGLERSIRQFFRSRLAKKKTPNEEIPGKDPQSLVFRLKIILDGKNADDISHLSIEEVEKLKKSLIDSIKYSFQ